jgi:heterodisulfide reductase subunit A-like polyferredoxin
MAYAEADLVVLSVGMEPSRSGQELARLLGVDLDPRGFCQTRPFAPTETNRPGIYVCGTFAEPKDIPDTVIQAGGAAALAQRLVGEARGTLIKEVVFTDEAPLSDEPRIGVFICSCGSNIASVVDVKAVVEYAKTLPHVAHAENMMYTCSADSLKTIPERIKEYGLNRVVVSACTPRTHEPLFQDTLRESGLNPYLFEMASIREHASWVHSDDPQAATEKAKDLTRMAVGRAALLEPLHKISLGLNHDALVIGGGIAGLTAALTIADGGFKVYLVERNTELGGYLRRVKTTVQGGDAQAYLKSLVDQVKNHPQIEVLTGTTVIKSGGFVGNFRTTLRSMDDPTQRLIEHGATVVATGAEEYRGNEFFLGQDPRVVTLGDLEEKLWKEPSDVAKAKEVVFIQCVGRSKEKFNYCSRICCAVALKEALAVKTLNPETNVYVLIRDMQAYGFREDLYTKARSAGVIFVRYDDEQVPDVTLEGGRLTVSVTDPALREALTFAPDLLVLASAVVPAEGTADLAPILKIPLSPDGFFLEAHIKLRPVDFPSEGLFLAGTAHYPKFADEAIAQGAAAASRAMTVLSRHELKVGGAIAHVTPEKCTACLTCVRVCPYGVPFINREGAAQIEVAQCQGCGTCVAECPAKAIELLHYKDAQIMAKTDALLEKVGKW